jgi:hypothetical protein
VDHIIIGALGKADLHRLPLDKLPKALPLLKRRDPDVKKLIVQPNGYSLQKETRPFQEGGFDSIHSLSVYAPQPCLLFSGPGRCELGTSQTRILRCIGDQETSDCGSARSQIYTERSYNCFPQNPFSLFALIPSHNYIRKLIPHPRQHGLHQPAALFFGRVQLGFERIAQPIIVHNDLSK